MMTQKSTSSFFFFFPEIIRNRISLRNDSIPLIFQVDFHLSRLPTEPPHELSVGVFSKRAGADLVVPAHEAHVSCTCDGRLTRMVCMHAWSDPESFAFCRMPARNARSERREHFMMCVMMCHRNKT